MNPPDLMTLRTRIDAARKRADQTEALCSILAGQAARQKTELTEALAELDRATAPLTPSAQEFGV
jgi:hypothetical protein